MAEPLPKELTRGYANQFLDALNRVHEHKLALTTKDLDDMDTQATLTEETETA